jgi:hypothetical protein
MRIRSTFLAFASIAAATVTSLAPANAYVHHTRHLRVLHPFFMNHPIPPGVLPCKRGIVWVCQ